MYVYVCEKVWKKLHHITTLGKYALYHFSQTQYIWFWFHSISIDINCAIKKWGNVTLDFSLSDLIESDRPPDMTKPQALGAYVLCVNVCSHRPRTFNKQISFWYGRLMCLLKPLTFSPWHFHCWYKYLHHAKSSCPIQVTQHATPQVFAHWPHRITCLTLWPTASENHYCRGIFLYKACLLRRHL